MTVGRRERISIDTAGHLLDFRGGVSSAISAHAAREQLEGAVALHNILLERRVAYLADEVGMGKTYVALGVLALFRHFDPNFRVLVIAPRENIQKKWVKELRNFTARNVRYPDLRVKAIQGSPVRAAVLCESLVELVRETAVDPNRDFFTRLTSFSLPLGTDADAWRKKRDQLLDHLPWLDPGLFDLRNKDVFKRNFAIAVNCGLPQFDLVIFDEGHNVKAGLRASSASRNQVLAHAFGREAPEVIRSAGFRGYGRRAKRVLFLSATPLENDYAQLWNQLDVFGFGDQALVLSNAKATDEERRDKAREFLIRRVTTIPVGDRALTRNVYRREWRNGGVSTHDEPLATPDERQRLAVALVQKKVSEVLGSSKFNNSFQIGMLASFESFLETARVRRKNDDPEATIFDDPDQTEDPEERLGIDVGAVNRLARSHRKHFQRELPHPKMDAIVGRLASSFTTGEKALVFVRRIASVKELQRKIEERYDEYLFTRLRAEIRPEMGPALDRIIRQYRNERASELERSRRTVALDAGTDEEAVVEDAPSEDPGGLESFFAWFFRGEGPEKILSGAMLQRRFSQAGSVHSTFFEDNYVSWLLSVRPGSVKAALAAYLKRPVDDVVAELETRAAAHLPNVKRQQRRNLFMAFQGAAIAMMTDQPGALQDSARALWEERFVTGELARGAARHPALEDWLEVDSFWTALRERPALRASLWPEPQTADFRLRLREQELRRELFSAMCRLGHPFIDLYVLSVNRIGRLELRAREQDDDSVGTLATEFLDLLERQQRQSDCLTSHRELAEAAANFDLILAVNEPGARDAPLAEAATRFGRLLRAQQPVGGMFGQVNETLVRQFRMPGYPLVLITTDLLQEGEDLHTFCSSVYHYGISWMPSSMEQRVGRVDRVSSQTDRRLTALGRLPDGEQLMQVYYPYLRDTVEVLQVNRVVERLNRFMRIMHEDLGGGVGGERTVDVASEIVRVQRDLEPFREPLQTAFPVQKRMLRAPKRPLAVRADSAARLLKRFGAMPRLLSATTIMWEDRPAQNALLGTLQLHTRRQPFTLVLRSSLGGWPTVRCISPVGYLDDLTLAVERVLDAARCSGVRLAAVRDDKVESYNLTIEGDVLLGARDADASRVGWLLHQVARVADRLEEMLLSVDEPMSTFRNDLEMEGGRAG